MQPLLRAFVFVVAVALPVSIASRTAAQDLHDLLTQALDQNVESINIANRPVRDALADLEKLTGVRTRIADDVLALLPYGERTQISLKIANLPLRQGMQRAFESLGLTMRIDRDNVVLEPSPMLARLGRQLTLDETALIGRLSTSPLADLSPEQCTLRFELDPAQNPREAFDKSVAALPSSAALRQIDEAAAALGWVWVVDNGAVVFRDRREFVKRALERRIDVSFQRTPLDTLLIELGRRVGVVVRFEPGCLKKIDARDQIVDLVQRDATVGQMLERIAGNTGLRYEPTADGVLISGPADPARAASAPAAGRVVAHLLMQLGDGATLLVPVREGELTPDELGRIEQVRINGLKAVREFLARPAQ